EKDFGLVFLGGKYLATYARLKSEGAWNTTIESGGKYIPYKASDEMIKCAEKAQSLFNLDFTCVDIAETDEGMFVFEVSAFGGFRGLMEANGIDAANLYVDYVMEKIKS
ncbi:MAG: ATP-grasp family protein, partial [Candidatus Coatesbacteria bacterium]|nr:ATP-grasp family protein [Candidatus Coatesbacteria bacterium]